MNKSLLLSIVAVLSNSAFAQTTSTNTISTSFGLTQRVNKGSVEFQVMADNTLNSAKNTVMTITSTTTTNASGKSVTKTTSAAAGALFDQKEFGLSLVTTANVNVSGKRYLQLRVLDGGDGNAFDHADWAGAKVTCSDGDHYLSDLVPTKLVPTATRNGWGPFETDSSNGEYLAGDGHPISLRGTFYQKGLGVHATSVLVFDLNNMGCTTFTSDIGVDDEVAGYVTPDQNLLTQSQIGSTNIGTAFDATKGSGWLTETGGPLSKTDLLLAEARLRRAVTKDGIVVENQGADVLRHERLLTDAFLRSIVNPGSVNYEQWTFVNSYSNVKDAGIIFVHILPGASGNGFPITIMNPPTLTSTFLATLPKAIQAPALALLQAISGSDFSVSSSAMTVTCNSDSSNTSIPYGITINNPTYIRGQVVDAINSSSITCPVKAVDADFVYGYLPTAHTVVTANGIDNSSFDNLGFVAAANMPIRAKDTNSPIPNTSFEYNAVLQLQNDKGYTFGGIQPYIYYGGMKFIAKSSDPTTYANDNGVYSIQFVPDSSLSADIVTVDCSQSPLVKVGIGTSYSTMPDSLRIVLANTMNSNQNCPMKAVILPSWNADPAASKQLFLTGGVSLTSVPDGEDYNPIYEQVFSSSFDPASVSNGAISVLAGDSYFVNSQYQFQVASTLNDLLNQTGSYQLLLMQPMTLDGASVRPDFAAALANAKVAGTIVSPATSSDLTLMSKYCATKTKTTTTKVNGKTITTLGSLDCSVALPSPCVKNSKTSLYDCSMAATHFTGAGATVSGTLFLQSGPLAVNNKISMVSVNVIPNIPVSDLLALNSGSTQIVTRGNMDLNSQPIINGSATLADHRQIIGSAFVVPPGLVSLSMVEFIIQKSTLTSVGASGFLTATIYKDINGLPDLSNSLGSSSLPLVNLSPLSSGAYADFPFPQPINVTSGSKYWVVLNSSVDSNADKDYVKFAAFSSFLPSSSDYLLGVINPYLSSLVNNQYGIATNFYLLTPPSSPINVTVNGKTVSVIHDPNQQVTLSFNETDPNAIYSWNDRNCQSNQPCTDTASTFLSNPASVTISCNAGYQLDATSGLCKLAIPTCQSGYAYLGNPGETGAGCYPAWTSSLNCQEINLGGDKQIWCSVPSSSSDITTKGELNDFAHSGTGIRYLYLSDVDNQSIGIAGYKSSNFIISPSTNLTWDWNYGQEQIGTYTYQNGSGTNLTFNCLGAASSKEQFTGLYSSTQTYGIGCSDGPGAGFKAYPAYSESPDQDMGLVCDDGSADYYASVMPQFNGLTLTQIGVIPGQLEYALNPNSACYNAHFYFQIAPTAPVVPPPVINPTACASGYTYIGNLGEKGAGCYPQVYAQNHYCYRFNLARTDPQSPIENWCDAGAFIATNQNSVVPSHSVRYLYKSLIGNFSFLYDTTNPLTNYVITPATNLPWNWTIGQGQEVTGTYYYNSGINSGGESFNCLGSAVSGDSVTSGYGIGCSNGPDQKVYPEPPTIDNPNMNQVGGYGQVCVGSSSSIPLQSDGSCGMALIFFQIVN